MSHVVNEHSDLEDPLFNKCAHGDIGPRKWLTKGTPLHDRLCAELTKKALVAGIKKASPLAQTSCLEGFHSVLNHFAPKMLAYSYTGMYCRHILAAVHFNCNLQRDVQLHKTTNQKRITTSYPKFKNGEAVVRDVRVKPNFEYIEEIFQTFLNATKDDLKKAAKQLKENAPPAMNMMLNKQSKAEAVKKRDEREKIVVKNVPPTTPGPYPEPYLLIEQKSQIYAIDLITFAESDVILERADKIAIDTVHNKLYFREGKQISRANFDGTGKEVIFKNMTRSSVMAIDWIGRRLFWSDGNYKQIHVGNLDGKERRLLLDISNNPDWIAVDPTVGYLFLTDRGSRTVQRISLATHSVVNLAEGFLIGDEITLDCPNKRVYWLESRYRKLFMCQIFSTDYDGGNKKDISIGFCYSKLVGVLEDMLYLLGSKENSAFIIEMNVFNGNISRHVFVEMSRFYNGFRVVDTSLQPVEKEGCPVIPCGPWSHCNKTNSSFTCQCEVGFVWNAGACKDVDECLSSPCGPETKNNCTNIAGSYKCTSCGKGFTPTTVDKCIAQSELPIRLVNSNNSKAGRVEVYIRIVGWIQFCAALWTDAESAVVCRQLGYTGVNTTRKDGYYGKGGSLFLIQKFQCVGNESSIYDCRPNKNDKLRCASDHYVGVECY